MLVVYVCGRWGVDGGWTPLPTRSQRYCDPTSLAFNEIGVPTTLVSRQKVVAVPSPTPLYIVILVISVKTQEESGFLARSTGVILF